MDVVEISGIRYVKASDAAKKMGYTSDYVGQLCRAGKIPSRRVGRTWYVEESSLSEHRETNARSNKQKTKELVEEELLKAEYERGRIHQNVYIPNFTPTYRKRLLETPIAYKTDEHPLFPQVREKHLTIEQDPQEFSVAVHTEEVTAKTDEESAEQPEIRHLKAVVDDAEGSFGIDEEIGEESEETVEETKPQQIFVLTEGEIPVHAVEDEEVAQSSAEEEVFVAAVAPQREPEVILSPIQNVSVVRRPILALVPVSATVLGLFIAGMTLFLQNVWVYQSGNGTVAERPYVESTYGVTAVSTVIHALSR